MKSRYIGQVETIAELAATLGVTHDALDLLRVGFDASEQAWWMPERNHHGWVIGVNRRFRDGAKRCAKGSRRGLTYCDYWMDYPGPALIVEGASDVAAGLSMNLCVIGRPSNVGGMEYLARLLRGLSKKRLVVVVGENDRREPEGKCAEGHAADCAGCQRCWPGRYGAETIAASLRTRLSSRVIVGFPGEAKDMRGFLNNYFDKSMKRTGQTLIKNIMVGQR